MNISRNYLLAAVLALTAGCSWGGWPYTSSRGHILSPGTAAQQRNQAQRFDPYPGIDSGPEVVGARPREFQEPPAEATRGRWPSWGWPRFGGAL